MYEITPAALATLSAAIKINLKPWHWQHLTAVSALVGFLALNSKQTGLGLGAPAS